MARNDKPFDEDIMTIFMGMDDPMKPGQHGKTDMPRKPESTAFEFITQLRDMCDEFIQGYDKEDTEPKEESDELQEDTE